MDCNCNNYYNTTDDLRLVKGNDFATLHDIFPKYPDGTSVEDFDLADVTDLTILVRRNNGSFKDVSTYCESNSITAPKQIRIDWDGLKMGLGSYRFDFSGKFQGRDWRSYSKSEGFGIVESNEDANIPVGSFIADGVYQIVTDFLMTYQTQDQSDWDETDTTLPTYIKNKPDLTIYVEKVAGYGLSKNDYSDEEKQKVTDLAMSQVAEVSYAPSTRQLNFYNEEGDLIMSGDVTSLAKDGKLNNVVVADGYLNFIFNSDAETAPISVPLSDLQDYTNIYTKSEVDSTLDGKVDKVSGKGLSTNDYTNTEKSKLASLSNYDDTEVRSMINAKYTKPSSGIPASDLASGVIPDVSNFITKSVNDLVNYYTKSQTYTQSEVDSLIAGISGFEYEVVATLPTASASTMHKIYLTPSSDPQTQNVKDEYITIQNGSTYSWEQIGSTAIDLSGYVTTTALNTALADYTTTTDLNTLLAGYQTKIDSTHKLDYSLLSNTPTIPDAQIQSDWEQTTTTAKDFIKNKPTIPINLHVELTKTGNTYTANYTLAQILASVNSGGHVDLEYDDYLYAYDGAESNQVFFHRIGSEDIETPSDNLYDNSFIVANSGGSDIWTIESIPLLANDVPTVVDALNSASTTAALSANQGKVLNDGKQATIDASHKLSADLVDDASTTNKFVTASEKTTWNGKADKVLVNNHGTSDTTYSLTPNLWHTWGTVSALTLTLATPTDNTTVNLYMFEFTSGATATTLSLPSTITWENGANPTIEANTRYEITIQNGGAKYSSFPTA